MSQDETNLPERDDGPLLRDPPPPPGWEDPLAGSLLGGSPREAREPAEEPEQDADQGAEVPPDAEPGQHAEPEQPGS